MIAEFNNIKDAQALCDKIHSFLQSTCKNYSASKWQDPVKAEKEENYYVQLPVEFQDIKEAIKIETDKATLTATLPEKFKSIKLDGSVEMKV